MDKIDSLAKVFVLRRRVDAQLAQRAGYPNARESVRILGTITELLESTDTSLMYGKQLLDVENTVALLLYYGMTLNKESEVYQEIAEKFFDEEVDDKPLYKLVADALGVREYLVQKHTAAILE